MPSAREHQAIAVARQYLENRGYAVEELGANPENKGYDLIAKRNAENLKIAVKACTRPWNSPRPSRDGSGRRKTPRRGFPLRRLLPRRVKKPKLCIIPREDLKPEFIVPKQGYRISGKLKKEAALRQFLHAL